MDVECRSDFVAEGLKPMAGLSAVHGCGESLEMYSFISTLLLRV